VSRIEVRCAVRVGALSESKQRTARSAKSTFSRMRRIAAIPGTIWIGGTSTCIIGEIET
jgi:hypothetical protein